MQTNNDSAINKAVRNTGSTKTGSSHWMAQRVSAMALVPLSIWLFVNLFSLDIDSLYTARQFVSFPLNAGLLILFIAAGFHHAQLGLQEVVEDYIANPTMRIACILIIKSVSTIGFMASTLAILYIAFA